MRLLFSGLIVVSIAFLAGCDLFGGSEEASPIETYTVAKGDLKITIRGKGTLKAKNSTAVRPNIRSEAKIAWIVEEGSTVAEGDVLVELDKTQLEQRIESLEEQVDSANRRLASAVSDYENQLLQNAKSIAGAELAVERAENELEKYINGDNVISERQKKLSVDEAESALTRAREDYEQSLELLKEEFVTKNQVEEDRLKVESAEVRFETAKLELELYQTYTHPMSLKQKQQAVDNAKTDLETTKKSIETVLRNRETHKDTSERDLKRAEEQLAEKRADVEHYTLLAPTPGLVIYGDPRGGGRGWGGDDQEIRVGSTLWGGQTIITLPDLSGFVISMSVHEVNVNKIQKGQQCFVKLESCPDLTLHGEITMIASVANQQGWWNRDEPKEFDVELTLDEASPDFRPGVSAAVEVLIGEKQDVLKVPASAVYFRDGVQVVYKKENGVVRKREVALGASNDNEIEILAGLEVGEEILLVSPEFFEDLGLTIAEESELLPESAKPKPEETNGGKKPGMKPDGRGERPQHPDGTEGKPTKRPGSPPRK